MQTAVDIENAKRRAVFDAGRTAKRRGLGPGKNPHWDGLYRQIWYNGWLWEEEYPQGSNPIAFIVSILAILAGLVALWFLIIR